MLLRMIKGIFYAGNSLRLFSLRRATDSGSGIPLRRVQKSSRLRCVMIVSLDRSKLWRPAPNNDGKLATLGFNSRSKIGPMRVHISSKCLGPMCGYFRSWNCRHEWVRGCGRVVSSNCNYSCRGKCIGNNRNEKYFKATQVGAFSYTNGSIWRRSIHTHAHHYITVTLLLFFFVPPDFALFLGYPGGQQGPIYAKWCIMRLLTGIRGKFTYSSSRSS